MCRHLAYLGPPLSLAELLLEPEHSLLRQTWAPRDMRGSGSVNADGFGIGWYVGADADPVRYRRSIPMWADATLPDLARTVRSGAVLAAVRNGTVGMPVLETACAPFTEGRWLVSHNGVVAGWPESVADLAKGLPVADLLTMEAPTDSVLVWTLLRHRLREGAGLAEAVAGVTAEVAQSAPGSRLNLLATDGELIVATTWQHSLAVRREDGGVLVASEPTDPDNSWEQVPDACLLVADRNDVHLSPLDGHPGRNPR